MMMAMRRRVSYSSPQFVRRGLSSSSSSSSAMALDALAAAGGSYAKAARALGLTTSQLLRFLRSDRHVWQASERFRTGT